MAARLQTYRLGSWRLASALALPELPAGAGPPDWTVLIGARRRRVRAPWFHHWHAPDGRRWLSFAEDGGAYVLRVARHGSFRVEPSARTITCEPPHTVPAHTRRHLLLNQVIPLALSLERTVLHASAVAVAGRGVVLVGPAGSGKSTLAAALARASCPLIADDTIVLERRGHTWLAHPGYPTLRLWPDAMDAVLGRHIAAAAVAHYTRKRRIDVSGVLPCIDQAVPIAAACLLGGDASPAPFTLRALSPREALVGLLPMCLQIDIRHRGRQLAALDALASMVSSVPVFELAITRNLSELAAAADRLILRLAGLAGRAPLGEVADGRCATLRR